MAYKVTGRTRIRTSLIKRRLILQVETRDDFYDHLVKWRDATLDDVQAIGLPEAVEPAIRKLQIVK